MDGSDMDITEGIYSIKQVALKDDHHSNNDKHSQGRSKVFSKNLTKTWLWDRTEDKLPGNKDEGDKDYLYIRWGDVRIWNEREKVSTK